jgi:hypothetical protein
MNYKLLLFTIIVICLIFMFVKYDIVTSSPELLEATQYNPSEFLQTQKTINDIITKAKLDTTSTIELFTSRIPDITDTPDTQDISVMMFFNQSCPHCQKFYPIWKHVTALINSDIHVTENECQKEKTLCSKYKINTVPTVIISMNGEETRYIGQMTVDEFTEKIKNLKIPMHTIQTEPFVDYISAAQVEAEGDTRKSKDPDCPYMSFYEAEPNNYCADSNYLYGCINASPGGDITAFDGAFGVITSYVNSIPSSNINTKKKCLANYAHTIKAWNLCDPLQLSAKRNYSQDIDMNLSKPRFLHVNYNDNKDSVDAINYVCGLATD